MQAKRMFQMALAASARVTSSAATAWILPNIRKDAQERAFSCIPWHQHF